MVESTLDRDLISGGSDVVSALDSEGLAITGAFWFYLADNEIWRLVLEVREFADLGPHETYKRILKAIQKKRITSVPLEDITVFPPGSDLVDLMRMAIRTGPGISGIRFTKNVINGVAIPDAYIYRLVDPSP